MSCSVFDKMAPGWYGFRHHTIFRPELEELARRWQAGRLLNIGCAHGPDFIPFKDSFELYGVDISPEMLKHALKYARKFNLKIDVREADARRLPFGDGVFDWAIAVATYHHLKGKAEMATALGELRRVLKSEGEAFITVWNGWQPRFWFKGREVLVPWKAGSEKVNRYYYLYSYPDIEKLLTKGGFQIIRSFPEASYRFPLKYFSRNICLLVKKQPGN